MHTLARLVVMGIMRESKKRGSQQMNGMPEAQRPILSRIRARFVALGSSLELRPAAAPFSLSQIFFVYVLEVDSMSVLTWRTNVKKSLMTNMVETNLGRIRLYWGRSPANVLIILP